MAVQGPNLKYAEDQSKRAIDQVLDLLKENFNVDTPHFLLFAEPYIKEVAKLKEAISQMFELDACDKW